jgi:hypothetical protein
MAKRSTIGDNPLDAVVPKPSDSKTASARTKGGGKAVRGGTRSTSRDAGQAESVPPSSVALLPPKEPQAVAAMSEGALATRVETLEQQNQYMKWLVGAVLAPLALLALLL